MPTNTKTRSLLTRLRGNAQQCYVAFEDELIPFGGVILEAIDEIERLHTRLEKQPTNTYTDEDITKVAAHMCARTLKISVEDALDLFRPIDRSRQNRQKKAINDKLEVFQREQRRLATVALETFGYRPKLPISNL
jgi:hypothetical protein